ncbi:MAG: LuxR family transcriptional regulator [Aeromicrobium sp.]
MPRPITPRSSLSGGPADEIFVGRDAVCDQLDRLLTAAPTGGGVRAVVGEPGIGRSALLRRVARRSTVPVHWVQGTEAESDLPYAAAADLLVPLASHFDELPVPQRDALRVALALSPGGPPEPLAICRGALNVVRAASSTAPFLVVVDDLHWIDQASRRVLTYVARRVAGQHLVMLLASRVDPWTEPIDQDLPMLRLAGLTVRDCEDLARRTGVVATRRELGLLVRATGGNPLALRESLDQVRGRGADDPRGVRVVVGRSVRRAWVPWVEALPLRTRTAVFAISALRLEETAAWPDLLADLGLDVDDLGPAEACGLLRVGPRGVVLRHPLLRHVVRDATPVPARWKVYQAFDRAGRPTEQAFRSLVPAIDDPPASAPVADPRTPIGRGRADGGEAFPGLDVLTAAETQVGRLVAAGRSNDEIALTLFVSRKTVEAHLTRVYRKLRIRSRSDLTRLVVGQTAGTGSEHAGEAQEVGDRAHG